MRRVVKRYANRKLYDTTSSRYVALEDIATFVRRGEEVEVTDNESGEDLTAVTFAQIILEDERKKKSFLSLPVLQELVRYGGDALAGISNRGLEALSEIRERAEKRVSEIVSEGPDRTGLLEGLQRRVDRGLKESVSRLRSATNLGAEVERLEKGLREIESRLRNLLARANGIDPSDDTEVEDEPPRSAATRPPGVG
jgi:polyhydroxyalkanoate synthesis repressor PhaR